MQDASDASQACVLPWPSAEGAEVGSHLVRPRFDSKNPWRRRSLLKATLATENLSEENQFMNGEEKASPRSHPRRGARLSQVQDLGESTTIRRKGRQALDAEPPLLLRMVSGRVEQIYSSPTIPRRIIRVIIPQMDIHNWIIDNIIYLSTGQIYILE